MKIAILSSVDAFPASGARRVELHEVRYFLAACRTLNFHKAALHCHVTQSALTRAIQKLEGELGWQLFQREHNHVQLTEFGRLMRPHLQEVQGRAEAAKSVAHSFLQLQAHTLDVGVIHSIGPRRFVGFWQDFRQRHSGIDVCLLEGTPARLRELLLAGTLEVALIAQPEPYEEGLAAEPIYLERFALAFPAGHAFEQRSTLSVADLKGELCLTRIHCEYRDVIAQICAARDIAVQGDFASESEDWIMAMIAAGIGICFTPEFSTLHPKVRHRVVDNPSIVREVCLVAVSRQTRSPAAAAFIDAVRNYDWTEVR